ncbi:hypothetical protein ACQYAD_00175 [Neobacillus sp. SM06]|uniref:hypothetical protein n=1 Tax=Neobacillus sp. SM06 TaxID=3422492 RepID=UPI003D2873C4
MKKLNLLISTLFLGLLISLSTGEIAFAKVKTSDSVVLKEKQGNLKITSIYYPQPIEYDFHDEAIISPMYIPYTGDEYEVATKTLYKSKNWGTVVTNNSSLNDSVTRTVSRSKFANGSIGTSAETAVNWKLIQGKIGINAEVSFGTSTTVSVTYTWNIPARSTTTISTGSLAVKTSGNIVHYSNGLATSRKAVNANYSYNEYSDKTSTPL